MTNLAPSAPLRASRSTLAARVERLTEAWNGVQRRALRGALAEHARFAVAPLDTMPNRRWPDSAAARGLHQPSRQGASSSLVEHRFEMGSPTLHPGP